jgi:hypothetical protein
MGLGIEFQAGNHNLTESKYIDFCFPIFGAPTGIWHPTIGGTLSSCFGIDIRTARITLPNNIRDYRAHRMRVSRIGSKKPSRPKIEMPKAVNNRFTGDDPMDLIGKLEIQVPLAINIFVKLQVNIFEIKVNVAGDTDLETDLPFTFEKEKYLPPGIW